jgi:uncharacterized protein (DUF433 family)
MPTATLNWAECSAVESIPGKRSGAWVFRDTRTPVSVVFDNLQAGATISEVMEWFHLSRDQVSAVLEFAARSLDAAPGGQANVQSSVPIVTADPRSATAPDAHTF